MTQFKAMNKMQREKYDKLDFIYGLFVQESLKIEGITRTPTLEELEEFKRFIELDKLTVGELTTFVSVWEPTAILRTQSGCDVRIGGHKPPSGGMNIFYAIENIIALANEQLHTPWRLHCMYEMLHPFSDGNGRSGRALWAWMMKKTGQDHFLDYGFLHLFYYQTLRNYRKFK